MRFSKQLFYDEVNDNWRKSKFMAKNKNRRRPVERGRIKVTPDEVIEKLKKLEVDTTRRTLLNYEKWGLVPEAVRGGAGKGKGRTTDYPDETPAEFYASIKLKSVYGLKVAVIARCRKTALLMEELGLDVEQLLTLDQELKERGMNPPSSETTVFEDLIYIPDCQTDEGTRYISLSGKAIDGPYCAPGVDVQLFSLNLFNPSLISELGFAQTWLETKTQISK